MAQPLPETVRQLLTKRDTLLAYVPASAVLGLSSNEVKTPVHTKACTAVFTALSLVTAPTWKPPRCPPR